MDAFWEGMLAGYGIAIPVGAIALLIVDVGLRQGFILGFMAGAGAATADFIYATLAALAGEAIAIALAPFDFGLRIASAVVLLALGGFGLWNSLRANSQDAAETNQLIVRGRINTFSRFLGLTLLNPLTVAYFSALILGRGTDSIINFGDKLYFIMGAGLASLSWQSLLAGIGAWAKKLLSQKFQIITSIIGNMVVILLGFRILIHLFGKG